MLRELGVDLAVRRQVPRSICASAAPPQAARGASVLRMADSGNEPPIFLAVASRYSSFPILLESYRECVRDTFDLANTATILLERSHGAKSASRRLNCKAIALRGVAFVFVCRQLYL